LTGIGEVRNCHLEDNAWNGLICLGGGVVSGCTVINSAEMGIYAAMDCLVKDCLVQNCGSYGIWVQPGKVSDCWVKNCKLAGILVNAPGSTVVGNTCIGNNYSAEPTKAGIYINDSNNRVEDNHVTGSGVAGIMIAGSYYPNNLIIKNSVAGNGTNNYVVPGAQIIGPLITATGVITNTSPWANFSF